MHINLNPKYSKRIVIVLIISMVLIDFTSWLMSFLTEALIAVVVIKLLTTNEKKTKEIVTKKDGDLYVK